eukprot:751264-Hanusia_phi.AAC.5
MQGDPRDDPKRGCCCGFKEMEQVLADQHSWDESEGKPEDKAPEGVVDMSGSQTRQAASRQAGNKYRSCEDERKDGSGC